MSTHVPFPTQPLPFPLGKSHKVLFTAATVRLSWVLRPPGDLYLVFIKFENHYVKSQTQGKAQSNILNAPVSAPVFSRR